MSNGGGEITFGSSGWPFGVLTITSADVKEGGTVKGSLVANTGAMEDKAYEGSLSGTFEATVCKRSWDAW